MPFHPAEHERVLSALNALTAFVEAQDVSTSCLTCMHWANGCTLARGQMPPAQVQREGCPSWDGDGVVFSGSGIYGLPRCTCAIVSGGVRALRRGVAMGTPGGELDQRRPCWQVSDEPEQSQDHEQDDEPHQAVPRSGLWLRAITPVKFHRRVP
jgi:hypothetical protein